MAKRKKNEEYINDLLTIIESLTNHIKHLYDSVNNLSFLLLETQKMFDQKIKALESKVNEGGEN